MSPSLNAEIVAIGTEILLGEITDTNSVYLARTLRDLGINLYFMTSVGDNEGRIESALRLALGRAQIVITCGGLGPTIDDMTRQSVAAATDRGLTFHQGLLDKIAERFAGFRVQMTENNRRQAYVPEDAVIIENPVGTAPAFAVEVGDRVIISLPGVPREMKFLMQERVIPYLREHYGLISETIKARNLKTAGIGESALDEMIGDELLNASNPSIGLAAHSGVIDIRITAKAASEAEADAMIAGMEADVRARVGAYIFGADGDTIENVLLAILRERGATLATIEAGIEGVVSERLQTAGAGDRLLAAETYVDREALAAALNLTAETPIRTLAERAAQTAADRVGATLAIALISTADGADDRADAEELSAVAVWMGGKVRSRAYGFGRDAEVVRTWTTTWTLAAAWRMLHEDERE